MAEPYGKYSIRFTHTYTTGRSVQKVNGILIGSAMTYDSIPGLAARLLDQLTDVEFGEIIRGHIPGSEL